MAPSTDIESHSDGISGGTIVLAVLVSVGGAIILTFFFITFLLFRRWKRNSANDLPHHVAVPPLRGHRVNISDSSVKPLLVDNLRGDWDYQEKFYPPIPISTDDDRDTLANNPTGLYHVPSVQTLSPTAFSTAPSSHCLPHGHDVKSVSDHHTPRTIQTERRSFPLLPPLTIPDSHVVHLHSQSRYPITADGDKPPEQSPPSPVSTDSHYSQQTADIGPSTPPAIYVPLPLSQELGYGAEPADEGLHRGDTHLVGNLLKARARRNPDGLVRTNTNVSHIERTGSIKSVGTIHQDDRPYSKRYRSKKKRVTQVGEMEIVKEASEAGSLRSRSDSLAAHWDPSLLTKIPPHVAGPRPPTPRKA